MNGSSATEIAAVGRLTKSPDGDEAEIAVLVSDKFQKHGFGTELIRRLIEIARDEKIRSIDANILQENLGMLALANRFGFKIVHDGDFSRVRAVLEL